MKRIVRDEDTTEGVNITIKVLEPALRLLRVTDGKGGATLSKLYGYMLQLDELYGNPIEGLAEPIRKKLHNLFMARWEYFHVPVMTAAYRFDPEFCKRDFSQQEEKEVRE
eukprot:scaffold12443_cov30-Tisochrysis_lutea.AAC.1